MVYQPFENDRGQVAVRYRVVDNRAAYDALGGGWYPGPDLALNAYDRQQEAIGEAAAHRAYVDRNMSATALLEAAAVEDSTRVHVAEIPETKRRPGRPRKVVA
jgi:hypothetical protein